MPSPRRFSTVRPTSGGAALLTAERSSSHALGRLLIQAGKLDAEALEAALAQQRKTFLPLGRILRDEYDLKEADLAEALRQQAHVARIYLRFVPISEATQKLLDPEFCRQHEALAFERVGTLLCVAFSKPPQRGLVKQIESSTDLEVKPYQAPWEDIARKLKIDE